jgi:uncharacterized protein
VNGEPAARAYWKSMALHSAPDTIRTILTETHTWAVVGCSPDPRRDSHRVARLLQQRGFRVIPVNPNADQVLGERCYPSLRDVPAGEGVEVIEYGARGVWMQLGVIDEAAAQRALAAGLLVVMNRCPAIELPRLAA